MVSHLNHTRHKNVMYLNSISHNTRVVNSNRFSVYLTMELEETILFYC